MVRLAVDLSVSAEDMLAVFRRAEALVADPTRLTPGAVADRLWARHARRVPSTGRGVALPHVEVRHLRHRSLLYLRTLHGLAGWPGGLVSDFLVLLAPYPSAPQDQVLLEHLHNGLMFSDFSDRLRAAPDVAAVRAVLAAHLGLRQFACAPLTTTVRRRGLGGGWHAA